MKNNDKMDLNSPYDIIAKLLNVESAKILYEQFNGKKINFPMKFIKTEVITEMIKDDYNTGLSILELVQKYKLHEKTIKRKLNKK